MSYRAACTVCPWRGRRRTPLAAAEEAFDHEVFHWVEESCRAQGVPLKVTDPATLKGIAALLRPATPTAPAGGRSPRPSP